MILRHAPNCLLGKLLENPVQFAQASRMSLVVPKNEAIIHSMKENKDFNRSLHRFISDIIFGEFAMHHMYCYQCEQTSQGTGCTTIGVCGKEPGTTKLQDMMVHICKGISQYEHRLNKMGKTNDAADRTVLEALFMTMTNVNFDEDEHVEYINGKLATTLESSKKAYLSLCESPAEISGPGQWKPFETKEELIKDSESVGVEVRAKDLDPDIASLQELLTYGVKGLAAYAHHAYLLGYENKDVYSFVHEALDYMTEKEQTLDKLVGYCLKAGEVNLLVMEMLDKAHTESFGNPEPTQVATTHEEGKAILVSGHDLKATYELLKQTEGKGVNVYTHGELLPANSYPELKKFAHLKGNYGSAWQHQQKEFDAFPGAVLITTNCLKPVEESYQDRIFTIDVVGHKGCKKVEGYDFSPVIEAALKEKGFTDTPEKKTTTIGFGHNAVLGAADKVVDLVKTGKVKHFFLIGGCDGAEFARNYFTDFAEKSPDDTIILTLGCGKFRVNHMDYGDIEGIPRLLDLGQCNDAYSAIRIATALSEAFEVGVNDLPLSLIISWFEQKAVAVLLTLLFLGIKDIRLGPTLPAFVSPNVLKLLVEKYNIQPTVNAEKDLKEILTPAQ